MSADLWTWDARANPDVLRLLEEPVTGLEWFDRIENAPTDATDGKVLCVCAAVAIAREVLAAQVGLAGAHQASEAFDLVRRWIDEPTDERFDRICSLIFDG